MDQPTRVAVRWSFITSVLILLYWFVFYLKTGTIPNNSDIVFDDWIFAIPVSRIFDFMIGPIICFLCLLSYRISIRCKVENPKHEIYSAMLIFLTFYTLSLMVVCIDKGFIHGIIGTSMFFIYFAIMLSLMYYMVRALNRLVDKYPLSEKEIQNTDRLLAKIKSSCLIRWLSGN